MDGELDKNLHLITNYLYSNIIRPMYINSWFGPVNAWLMSG